MYSVYNHDCMATHNATAIIIFADETTMVGLIVDTDETAYGE
jgi:hypothetical protein